MRRLGFTGDAVDFSTVPADGLSGLGFTVATHPLPVFRRTADGPWIRSEPRR